MIDLTRKTAIVTGGSRGIGRSVVLMLARAGASVVFGYRQDHVAAQSVIEQLRIEGKEALCCAGDVRSRRAVQELFLLAKQSFGCIDIVVANAGIWKRSPIEDMSDQDWNEMIDTNLKSVFFTCQAAAREMKPLGRGRIILISSTAGQRGEPFYSHYAATKGALISFTKSLAAELGPANIHVNAVAPGWVSTDMSATLLANVEELAKIEALIPLRRIATPNDIAGPVLFLASELAGHIQGEVLNANGGAVLCG